MPLEQELTSPWKEFLSELDAKLTEPVALYCIGGFAVRYFYRMSSWMTGDLDYYSVLPFQCGDDLEKLAGVGSALARKYKLRIHRVTVNAMPEDFEARSTEMFPGRFRNFHIHAPDPYDMILSKLERNSPKDFDDAQFLARTLSLDPQVLRERYRERLRPYLVGNEERHDLTLKLWIDACFPEQGEENQP